MSRLLSRREMLGLGFGAAGALLVAPRFLGAASPPALDDDLQMAMRAAKWIQRSRIETKAGVAWPSDPLRPDSVGMDLYGGMPGIVLFYLELYAATKDSTWLDEARLGANEMLERLPVLQRPGASGLYDGLGGVAFVLEETHRATGQGKYRDGACMVIEMIHSLATRTILGARWPHAAASNDIFSGIAGTGLVLLWADRVIDDPGSRTMALAAGRQVLDYGIPASGGTKWAANVGDTTLHPNFAHGTAGVAYFLATLLLATGDRSFMAGAVAGAKYLETIADTSNDGFRIFDHEPGGEHTYSAGWRNGPIGTARLFYQLAEMTGRQKWIDLVHASTRSALAMGLPDGTSKNDPMSVGQADGLAGLGDFLVSVQRTLPEAQNVAAIDRVTDHLQARAVAEGDGYRWRELNGTGPAVAKTGYMEGAAGIGSYFLHSAALKAGSKSVLLWPDSPWSRECVPREKTERDLSDITGKPPRRC